MVSLFFAIDEKLSQDFFSWKAAVIRVAGQKHFRFAMQASKQCVKNKNRGSFGNLIMTRLLTHPAKIELLKFMV
jgi:hypothetical protein